jgi:hypothetical protein
MQSYVFIGSVPAKIYYTDFRKVGNDLDIICRNYSGNSNFVEKHCPDSIKGFQWILENSESWCASPDILYTLKFSHAIYNIHWDKTIHDIRFFQSKGCKLIPELLEILRKDWEIKHGAKKLSLNMKSNEFFNEYVYRRYPHDLLHKFVAHEEIPMYQKCLKDEQEILIDKEKFFKLSYEQQINMFREEIYVQALERYILVDKPLNIIVAYNRALKDVVTRLTKGWASDFILTNIEEYVTFNKQFTKGFEEWIKNNN